MALVGWVWRENGLQNPCPGGAEGPGGAPVYILGKGIPTQVQKSQGKTEILVLFGEGAGSLVLNGNPCQRLRRKISE